MKKTVGVLVCIVLLLVSCGQQASPATEMALAPSETPLPPTEPPVPPTATPVPPTDTPLPPTATTAPPSATPTPTPIPPTATATATPTPEPFPGPDFEGIVVNYNGRGCTVSAPAELPVGEHQFAVNNLTRQNVRVSVSHLLCGHTFEDLVEIQGEPGMDFPLLPWTVFADYTTERNPSTGDFIYTVSLDEAGEYGIALFNQISQNLWMCGPLTVTEGPLPLPPTATPEFTSCDGVEGVCLELTFDGDTCTYAGPTDFAEGRVTLLFINASEGPAAVNLARHDPGKTIQDMIDTFKDGVSTQYQAWFPYYPPWTLPVGTWETVNPGQNQVWRGTLGPGIYSMVCGRICPYLVWYGTGLTVEE